MESICWLNQIIALFIKDVHEFALIFIAYNSPLLIDKIQIFVPWLVVKSLHWVTIYLWDYPRRDSNK